MKKEQAKAFRVGIGRGGIAGRFNRRRFSLDMSLFPSDTKERYMKVRDLPLPETADDSGEMSPDFSRVFIIGGAFIGTKSKIKNKFTDTNESASFAVTGYFDPEGKTDGIIPFYHFVNLPSHMVQQVKELIADVDAVNAINAGALGFQVYQYTDRQFNNVCYSVNLVDIEIDAE